MVESEYQKLEKSSEDTPLEVSITLTKQQTLRDAILAANVAMVSAYNMPLNHQDIIWNTDTQLLLLGNAPLMLHDFFQGQQTTLYIQRNKQTVVFSTNQDTEQNKQFCRMLNAYATRVIGQNNGAYKQQSFRF